MTFGGNSLIASRTSQRQRVRRSNDRAAVEIVAERQDRDSDDRVEHFIAVVRHGERAGHDAEAEASDRGRHHETMLNDAASESGNAEPHGEKEAHFMEERVQQHAACGGEHRHQDGAGEAMDDAKARKADGHPVDHSSPGNIYAHEPSSPAPPIILGAGSYNITSNEKFRRN